MSLVAHARAELERIGQFAEDPEYAESLVAAVAAFASYGHSGGSAACGIAQLERLLRFQPLGPLTDDPGEWQPIAAITPTWQSRRSPACFSPDGGRTYYDLDECQPRWRRLAERVLRRHRPKYHRSVLSTGSRP